MTLLSEMQVLLCFTILYTIFIIDHHLLAYLLQLGALYSLLRGVYKDMTILHRAEAEKKESLVEENRLLRAHLSEVSLILILNSFLHPPT